jgi:hypothetical protein
MIVFLVLLIVLAFTGFLGFILKVALGVALGLILGIAVAGWLVAWRIRRALFGSHPRWRRLRGSSSNIEVLDRGRRRPDF